MPATAGPSDANTVLAVPGPDLCLAFANTKYWRGTTTPTEGLVGPADLLKWATSDGGIPAELATATADIWQANPRTEATAFANAIAIREALYRLLASLAEGGKPATSDLAAFNEVLARTPGRERLVPVGEGFGWSVRGAPARETTLIAPVLWSTGDLLASPRRDRVRCCSNDKCRWVFVDDSRAGTRRWCMMSACGNRAKAQRHYERHRKA